MGIKVTLLSATVAISILTLDITAFARFANSEPKVGDSITQVEGEGVKITEIESRRLLPNGKIGGSNSAIIQTESTVEDINFKNRTLNLKSSDGSLVELKVGPEVKNFNQIKKGDKVSAEYLVSVAFEVRKPTADELAASGTAVGAAVKAKLGEMPAAGSATAQLKVAEIVGIDNEAKTVTFKGLSDDGLSTLKAKHPENLAYAKVGDTVVVTGLEAFATNVTRVK